MSRGAALSLYALLVLIWSSTWVAIKIGLEDAPALLGAGIRFAAAGVLLLGFAALRRRPLKTDRTLAVILGLLPFAFCYGLVYWGEQYIPSGLTAVLFGVMPLYTAILAALLLQDEPLRARLLAGVALALAGLALAFVESLELGQRGPRGDRRGRGRAVAARRRARQRRAQAARGRARRDRAQRLGDAGRRCAAAGRLRRVGGLGRRGVERERARLDPLPRGRRLRGRVRGAHDPAARDVRAGELVHRADDPVRRADLRRAALRRGDHRPRGGGRRARRRRAARRARAAARRGAAASRRRRARDAPEQVAA